MDWYTDAEQRAIDTAGRLTVMSLQKLRARDEAHREPYVPWTVSAGARTAEPNNRRSIIVKFLGREPALWIAFAGSAIQVVSSLIFALSVDQQGTLNAIVVAVFGVATAFAVSGDQMVPAILGFFKGLIALGIAFGLNLAPENQALVMVLVGTIVALAVRDRVVAPVTAAEVLADA